MIIKLAHTADNHLRDTQYSRKHRGVDFAHSFTYMVDKCIEKKVSAILNSGDIIDTTRPSPDVLTTLKAVHKKLMAARIPLYVISGNHDKTRPHWVSILSATDHNSGGIICIDGETVNIEGVTIRGMPHMSRDMFLEQEALHDPADILLWHGAIIEFIDFPSKKALNLSELPQNRYKLIAMGDIHVHESKNLEDGTIVAYPGSTEICRVNENPKKFVDIYEIDTDNGNKINGVQAIPLPCRKLFYELILDEEQFAELLPRLEAAKGEFPIVHIRYNKHTVENVSARVRAIMDSDRCIIRTIPFSDKFSLPNRGASTEDLLAPVEFVERFIIRGSKLYELGESLAQKHNDAEKILNTYIEEQLGRTELTG